MIFFLTPSSFACTLDWLADKETSGFVFPAICWEKSYIPWDIWCAGDSNSNLIESVHSDANREGVHCTLLGGLHKGQAFDSMRLKSLQVGGSPGFHWLALIVS